MSVEIIEVQQSTIGKPGWTTVWSMNANVSDVIEVAFATMKGLDDNCSSFADSFRVVRVRREILTVIEQKFVEKPPED